MEAKNLEELLNGIICVNINNAYVSSHKEIVLDVVNSILNKNRKYFDILNAFCNYKLNKWSSETRKELNLDIDFFRYAIASDGLINYFGFCHPTNLKIHQLNLECIDNEIRFIEDILNNIKGKGNNVMKALFLSNDKAPSQYMVNCHFEPVLSTICDNYYKVFIENRRLLKEAENGLNNDYKIAYHNTDLLIKNIALIKDNDKIKSKYFDNNELCDKFDQVLDSLDDFYKNTSYKKIVTLVAQGYNIGQIARMLNKSRTFVRQRYDDSIKTLSALLFSAVT